GLNAIGAEPELTLSLLPSAHAVLFILAADTGVTQSDLVVWRDHVSAAGQNRGRLAVLNKIDGLWDGLRPATEIDEEISSQVAVSARILGLPPEQVFPVSAQKGLVAKINGDEAMLEKSCLPALERALAEELLPAKQQIVTETIAAEAQDLVATTDALLNTRLGGLRDQLAELTDLRGKNQSVIHYMMRKVKSEKDDFEKGLQQYYAVRSVLSQLTNNLFSHLGMEALRENTRRTREAMRDASFSKGLSDAMSGLFKAVRGNLAKSAKEIDEIAAMMEAMYQRFSVEHGMKLDAPRAFSLARHEKEIDRLEESFKRQFGGFLVILTREKRVLTQQFFETIAVQIRKTFEKANRDVEHWLRAIMAPIESQVREIQLQLKRRLESVKRIHEATDTLEDRIAELEHGEQLLLGQRAELGEFGEDLLRGEKAADEVLRLATAA
ncbi:MAG: GTPase, partial [Rhodocyclaceae bacterium]|nr:GTPase [Rhodocyclaceae bacterium]